MTKIKRLIVFAALAVGPIFKPAAHAGPLAEFWADVKAQSDLKLGDNIQPAVFYNVRKGVPATSRLTDGVVTTLYVYRQLDLNVGGLQGLNRGTKFIPVGTVDFRVDKYIAKGLSWIPGLLGEPANSDFFKRVKIGPFFAYDFQDRVKSYGFAATIFFGALPASS